MDKITKLFQTETQTKANDYENIFIASNSTIDADGDIMDVKKIDLDRFNKNGIVLAGHEPTIEKAVATGNAYIEGESLMLGITKWATDEYAQMVKSKVDDGIIKTVSIGFMPKEDGEYKDGVYQWGSVELLEVSLVPIPSNKDAVKVKEVKEEKPLTPVEANFKFLNDIFLSKRK